MSSIQRTLDGDVQVHHLGRNEQAIDAELLAKHGRTARTLAKEGTLHLTLMALAPGGDLPVHNADGPVSIHLLEGDVVFAVRGQDHLLGVGDVMILPAGVHHSAKSEQGCVFLLTVVHAPHAPSPVT